MKDGEPEKSREGQKTTERGEGEMERKKRMKRVNRVRGKQKRDELAKYDGKN